MWEEEEMSVMEEGVLDGEARPHISFVFFIILKPPNCSEYGIVFESPYWRG